MRFFIDPVGLHSLAMVRVARALEHRAPAWVQVVHRVEDAETQLLHVISTDAVAYAATLSECGKRYAVAQYCGSTACGDPSVWRSLWRGAELVWSYYDIATAVADAGVRFFHAPLGVDRAFHGPPGRPRRDGVVTTGYVSGPGAEPIAEVWQACERLGIGGVHVGPPRVSGAPAKPPPGWRMLSNLTDGELAEIYRSTEWVSGMRHVEGFELPAAEGLACGARAIVFDQPATRTWYGRHAEYLPDVCGDELVEALVSLLDAPPRRVEEHERQDVLRRFDWQRIAQEFWDELEPTRASTDQFTTEQIEEVA